MARARPSGGGAGGSSFGIAYSGPKPDVDLPTESTIAVAAKAPGGQLAGTNPGLEGLSQPVYEAK